MALGEDREQGDGLGSSSSSVGWGCNHAVNMQQNLILGGLQQTLMPATPLLPGLPCHAAGCLGMGHLQPHSAAGRCCQLSGDQEHQCSYWGDWCAERWGPHPSFVFSP